MTNKGQPFFFDTNVFDPDDPRYTPNPGEMPKLEYTQDQLSQAKNASFEAGRIAGFKETQTSMMQEIQKIVQKIERDMATLFAAENTRNTIFEAEAVNLTLSIFRKIFPVYAEKTGTDEIKAFIQGVLNENHPSNKISIEVASSLQEGLQEFVDQITAGTKEQIVVNGNPGMSKQACKILWENGGITYDMKQIADRIEKTMQESLAVYGINGHDSQAEKAGE